MNEVDIVRAWKDEAYRVSLTDAQRGTLPENPAGLVELNDVDLEGLVGGNGVLAALGSGAGTRTYRPCPTITPMRCTSSYHCKTRRYPYCALAPSDA